MILSTESNLKANVFTPAVHPHAQHHLEHSLINQLTSDRHFKRGHSQYAPHQTCTTTREGRVNSATKLSYLSTGKTTRVRSGKSAVPSNLSQPTAAAQPKCCHRHHDRLKFLSLVSENYPQELQASQNLQPKHFESQKLQLHEPSMWVIWPRSSGSTITKLSS